jgi:hypothetical protein
MEPASDDEEYVPNENEIFGYAEFLGMDPELDKDYLWIAVEGLKAPVPKPWQTIYDANEEMYYINEETGEKMYDHPLDEHYRQLFQETKQQNEGVSAIQEQ